MSTFLAVNLFGNLIGLWTLWVMEMIESGPLNVGPLSMLQEPLGYLGAS